ncbi:GumC family protein [Pseudomonas sp. zbq_18]|uniref:GumC family protein n=1 Tax=Pseudomonadota TaxID=1224 RepID=UPI00370A942B
MDHSRSLIIDRTLANRATPEDDDSIDLLRLWRTVWRAKWNIGAFVVTVTMLAVLLVLNMTPQYQAGATLLIEERNPKVLSFQQMYDSAASGGSEYLLTQLGLLQSRALAERVVDKLNLDQHPLFDPRQQPQPAFDPRAWLKSAQLSQLLPGATPQELEPEPTISDEMAFTAATYALRQRINVNAVGKSQLISVGVELPDAQLAAQVANALAESFIESQLEASMNTALATAGWMNNRLEELREKLQNAENALQAYREQEGLVDVDGVSTISANELALTSNRMIDARRQRAEAESQYRQVQSLARGDLDRAASEPAVLGNPLIQQFKADQARAQAKVEELSRRYGEKHPTMLAARSELAAATSSLREQVKQVVAGIERNYQLAVANENSLRQSYDRNKVQIQEISRKEFKLRELQRDVDSNRTLYETFLTRLKETAATSDIDSANARIIDHAMPPLRPAKPRKSLIVAIAIVLASIVGVGLTLLLEALNNTFKSPEDVETKLNAPVLGIVPLVPRKQRHKVMHLFEQDADKYFCESIRTLRTSLVLSAMDTPRPIVLVTSSLPDEGKSTVATNLASSMAHLESVLLVDADLRRPTLARNFDLPVGTPGLANLIAGTATLDECLKRIGNIDVLPAGMVPPNPLELLSSPRLAQLLETLKGRYQRIIIDSPPTQAVSDTLLLATHSSALIYVIRAHSTPIPLVQKGVGQLLQNNAPVTGMVLNQVNLKSAGKYNYDYAKHYSAYATSAPSN